MFDFAVFKFELEMPRIVAVIVGHSYVKRLAEEYGSGRLPHRGPVELELKFVGIGGGRVCPGDPRKDLFMVINEVKAYHPDLVFIQAGENDLPFESQRAVFENLLSFAKAIAQECRPHTVITGQLIHFPVHDPLGPVSKRINDSLEAHYPRDSPPMVGITRLRYWWHKAGLYGENRRNYFARDDVHLNVRGMAKFYRSIMAALGKRAREILLEWESANH